MPNIKSLLYRSIEKPRLSGITNHGCTHRYIYIITLQRISFGPTKYTSHFPGANIFPFDSSDQRVRAGCRVLGDPGDMMAFFAAT